MPYITKERRERIDKDLNELINSLNALNAVDGDLNYVFTSLLDRVLDLKNTKYSKINTAVGALECTKLELYRRRATEYENEKPKINGDVYEQ